jgi:hypothetical protein
MLEIDVGSPCATHSDFGRTRRGSAVQPNDIMRMVTPDDGPDVVVWCLADSDPDERMRMPLFRVRRGAVSSDDVSMVTRALTMRTSRFSGTRPGSNASDPGSGSITMGSYERRDMPATIMLRKAGVRIRGNVVCRQTAFTHRMPRQWVKVQPVISQISALHQEMDPARHAKQLAFVKEQVDPAYHINDTAYTTATVNRNHVTLIHVDKGDFKGGSGAMLIVGEGGFRGCELCFPRYGVGVELAPGDVVICDVHEWHGNLPLVHDAEEASISQRLSIVAYVREKLALCTQMIEGGGGSGPAFGVPEGAILPRLDALEPRRRRFRVGHINIKRKCTWRIQKTSWCLNAVADYARTFGRVPPVGTSHLDVEVGVWCFHRREEKRSGKLSAERALEIERAVPCWSWEPDRRDTSHAHATKKRAAAESFAATLAVLERFVATHGRLPRSKERSEQEDVALGKWVVNRRQDIKNGKASSGETRDWSRLAEILGMSLSQ